MVLRPIIAFWIGVPLCRNQDGAWCLNIWCRHQCGQGRNLDTLRAPCSKRRLEKLGCTLSQKIWLLSKYIISIQNFDLVPKAKIWSIQGPPPPRQKRGGGQLPACDDPWVMGSLLHPLNQFSNAPVKKVTLPIRTYNKMRFFSNFLNIYRRTLIWQCAMQDVGLGHIGFNLKVTKSSHYFLFGII